MAVDDGAPRRSTRSGAETAAHDTTARTGLLTLLGTVVPGAGLLAAGRKVAGGVILAVFVLALVVLGYLVLVRREFLVSLALNPSFLRTLAVVLPLLGGAWVAVIVATHLALRPRSANRAQRGVGAVVVTVLAFLVAAPTAVGAVYSNDSASLLQALFRSDDQTKSATKPSDGPKPTAKDPWEGKPRVNILLLGGDSDEGKRDGVRTDTIMVASIDTKTGNTTLFALPRNTARMPFPDDSPLHDLYPNGFTNGNSDDLEYMLNAMYRNIPATVDQDILGPTDNLGADVLKLSVGEALGLKIDYYVLLDIEGLVQMIDALGGITVNINPPAVPIGGDHDRGIPPKDYIQPGPDQHLDGFKAMWFARGRYNVDDYVRMERQRCVIDAVIQQANPANVITRYEAIARAGKSLILTDIPQEALPSFLTLGLRVKDANVRSLVFDPGTGFNSASPDFAWVRSKVKQAIGEAAKPKPSPSKKPNAPTTSSSSGGSSSPGQSPSQKPSSGSSTEASVDLSAACAYTG